MLDSPRRVAFAALVLVTGIVLITLAGLGWSTGRMVHVGDQSAVRVDVPKDVPVEKNSTGYDGEFVYALSISPFTKAETVHGIVIDNPPYRQQRIGLPLVAWTVDHLTPFPLSVVLILINGVSIVIAAFFGAKWAAAYGRHAAWGLVVALIPAVAMGLVRDLTEPMAWAALIAGLWHWRSGRYPVAAALFCVTILTRETALTIFAGMGLWSLFRGPGATYVERFRRAGWLLAPLAAFVTVQVWIHSIRGMWPVTSNEGNLDPPFVGVFRHFFDGWHTGVLEKDKWLSDLWMFERVGLLAFIVLIAVRLVRMAAPPELRAGWVCTAAIAFSTTWIRDIQFLRAANECIAIGALLLLTLPGRASRLALSGVAVVSAASVFVYGVTI